jgi:hypothetical protein
LALAVQIQNKYLQQVRSRGFGKTSSPGDCRTTKTAAALLLSVLITIISVSPCLPQSTPLPGSVTVEGTWLVTSVPPDYAGDSLGKRIAIRGKGPGEYEVIYHTGETLNYWGNQTEIKAGQNLTFDQLKKAFQGKGVLDSAIREAAGVQKTFSYVLSPDGHTMQFLQTGISFHYNPKSGFMVEMTKGVFRWVTGKAAAARKEMAELKIDLPPLVGGIRGTDFEAVVEPKGRGRVALYSGQLEIAEKKTGYTFILDAGQMVTFGPEGKVSRPKKIKGAQMLEDEEED